MQLRQSWADLRPYSYISRSQSSVGRSPMHKIENPKTVECPVLSPIKQVLWDAANYMDENGWCPGPSGCAIHAIVMTFHRQGGPSLEMESEVIDVLQQYINDSGE